MGKLVILISEEKSTKEKFCYPTCRPLITKSSKLLLNCKGRFLPEKKRFFLSSSQLGLSLKIFDAKVIYLFLLVFMRECFVKRRNGPDFSNLLKVMFLVAMNILKRHNKIDAICMPEIQINALPESLFFVLMLWKCLCSDWRILWIILSKILKNGSTSIWNME